ncbi:MAG: methionyl-tRNA formyltransferase, partial [Candidatus Nanopelagicales bacterium]
MRLGFAGTPAVAASILSSLSSSDIKFEVVITKPDTTGRRGNQIIESEVSQIANKLGIRLLKPHRLDESFAAQLAALSLDAIIVVAYGKLIPTSLLEIPRSGWFNLHFSLLPKFRGASPVQTALLKGEVQTGVSLFK